MTSDSREHTQLQRGLLAQKLIETGEKERLKDFLRVKLAESGWRDEMKSYCRAEIEQKGLDNISLEWIVAQITPRGRNSVPGAIKAELLQRIRQFLTSNIPSTTTHSR